MKRYLLAASAAALVTIGGLAPAWAEYQTAHRGGTMRLLARSSGGTLDPQINYTLQYWQIFQPIYDGLVTFKKADGAKGFEIVPDLAEALPTMSNDGKTLTFQLRKGIKFSTGQEVTVKEVVASFQRIFKVSSPTSGSFYAGIVGADKCLAETASCTLEGGVVGDEAAGTITMQAVGDTTVTAKPVVNNGNLELEITDVSGPFEKDTVQTALDGLTTKLNDAYPLGIHADSVSVTDTGVVGKFSSQNASIPNDDSDDACFAKL